jgi:1,4-alpha-glucan branching enzyme
MSLGAAVTYSAMSSRASRDAVARASTQASAGARTVGLSPIDREVVRFELSAPKASRVALVGSFNEWNPGATPLVRDAATGKWMVSIPLAPGRHVYAFVVDGDVTADPSAPRAADDDFGSSNSVVFVSTPRT